MVYRDNCAYGAVYLSKLQYTYSKLTLILTLVLVGILHCMHSYRNIPDGTLYHLTKEHIIWGDTHHGE